jgi:hypothetical protein
MLHDVIWKLSDRVAWKRALSLACAGQPDSWILARKLYGDFQKHLDSHPLEWPSSSRPPSEHTVRLSGRILVHYRLIPDAQTVEILSVKALDKHSAA